MKKEKTKMMIGIILITTLWILTMLFWITDANNNKIEMKETYEYIVLEDLGNQNHIDFIKTTTYYGEEFHKPIDIDGTECNIDFYRIDNWEEKIK